MNRSNYRVRKVTLGDESGDDLRGLSPEQRVAMVWTVTLQAWMFKEGRLDEPRFRRDVVRTIRKPG